MKYIFSFLLFLNILLANEDFVEPDKAFKVTFIKNDSHININVDLYKDIYIYDKQVKIFINTTNVTKSIFTKKPIDYEGFMVHKGKFDIKIPFESIKKHSNGKYLIKFKFQGCSGAGLCYAPMTKKYKGSIKFNNIKKGNPSSFISSLPKPLIEQEIKKENLNNQIKPLITQKTSIKKEEVVSEDQKIANLFSNDNFFIVLLTFFGFGLLLSLTPCIFPMIPILSSVIVQNTNKEGKMTAKKGFILSLVYVLSMAFAYSLAGIFAGLFGANIQAMLQNPYVLIGFAGVFVALAFSLFGYYSLEMPQSIQNKVNNFTGKKGKEGGLGSVAIMGFLSALIVGPCVAPPLAGALVYIGQTGDALLGGLALFFMSLGLGIPLLVVGAGAGKYMPKPGGWMENVSKVFGLVMLGLSIFMLDRILPPIITMYLWSILFVSSGLYLFNFKHIIMKTISTFILTFGIIIFIGGLTGSTNILKPLEYISVKNNSNTNNQKLSFKKISSFSAFEKELSNSDKPIMVDFWATWCSSCKELDNFTFTNEKVISELQKYKLLKIDVSQNTDFDKSIMKRFNIFGPPALIFFNKDGSLDKNKRIIGYKSANDFLKIIK